jgi:hypothetical protein
MKYTKGHKNRKNPKKKKRKKRRRKKEVIQEKTPAKTNHNRNPKTPQQKPAHKP